MLSDIYPAMQGRMDSDKHLLFHADKARSAGGIRAIRKWSGLNQKELQMESSYKSCRYNGKRMRQHRAVFLSIVEKFSFTKSEREEYMSDLVVHHINGDKKDNRRCNLRFMSRRAHARLHSKQRHRNNLGRFI